MLTERIRLKSLCVKKKSLISTIKFLEEKLLQEKPVQGINFSKLLVTVDLKNNRTIAVDWQTDEKPTRFLMRTLDENLEKVKRIQIEYRSPELTVNFDSGFSGSLVELTVQATKNEVLLSAIERIRSTMKWKQGYNHLVSNLFTPIILILIFWFSFFVAMPTKGWDTQVVSLIFWVSLLAISLPGSIFLGSYLEKLYPRFVITDGNDASAHNLERDWKALIVPAILIPALFFLLSRLWR